MAPDLVVLGGCNPDLLLTGDVVPAFGQAEQLVTATLAIEGSGAVTAAAAARLGVRVALVSVVGDDALGRIQLDALRALGGCVQGRGRWWSEHGLVGDPFARPRSRDFDFAGSIDALSGSRVDSALLCGTRHVHVSSYFLQRGLQAGLARLLTAARDGGATISLDPNWDPAESWDGDLFAFLPLIDYLLANEQEVCRITRQKSVELAAEQLATHVEAAVVIKRGAAGALLCSGGRLVAGAVRLTTRGSST